MGKMVNDVYLSGVLHFLKGESYGESRLGKYFEFSLKRQYKDVDGCERTDYLPIRAFDPKIKDWVSSQEEGTPIWVAGELRSSLGSGSVFVLATKIQLLSEV